MNACGIFRSILYLSNCLPSSASLSIIITVVSLEVNMKLSMTFCGVSITRNSSSSSTSRSSCRAMVEHARREDGLLLTMREGGLGVGT